MNAKQNPKRRSTQNTGHFAALANLLRSEGTSAPSVAPRTRTLFALLLALGALFTVTASPAMAGQVRLFAGTFGAGTSSPTNPYPLLNAEDIAVDQETHDFYVGDRVNAATGSKVEKFDSSGHFILMFGKDVNKTKVEEVGSTEAERNLCTAASGDECQGGNTPFPHHSALEEPAHIAVDNSPGPSKGDVYIANDADISPSPPGVIEKFDSSGHLISSWATAGRLDGSAVAHPPAPIAGPFGQIGDITVDPSGNLWVTDVISKSVFEFRQDAGFITDWEALNEFKIPGAKSIAVDSEESVYVGNGTAAGIYKYHSNGTLIGQVSPSTSDPSTVSSVGDFVVDSHTDDLYVDRADPGTVNRYDSSCQPVVIAGTAPEGCTPAETFGDGLLPRSPRGLAIDPSTPADTLYVAGSEVEGVPSRVTTFAVETVPDVLTTKPTSPTQTSATLTGTVNPSGIELNEGLKGCRFEYVEAALYEPSAPSPYAAGHTVACDKTALEIGKGSAPVEVKSPITGLEAGKTYHYRLVAGNPNDVNADIDEPSFAADLSFGPPLLESTSAIEVAATSAILQAEVNPNDLDTHLRLEYGAEAGLYGNATPEVDIGSAGSSQTVSFHLNGLAPATTYHYRVVAENVLGEAADAVIGPDRALTTQTPGPFALLDSRRWELVTPPDKQGAAISGISEVGIIQAAADGNAISYLSNAPTEPVPAGNADVNQVLSTRASNGWASLDITAPHNSATGHPIGPGDEYKFFSEDLSVGIPEPLGAFIPQLSPEASESTTFLHYDYLGGDPTKICRTSCYRPLVTGKPGFANVPEGTKFGEEGQCPPFAVCGPYFQGATADASDIVLGSEVPLTETPAPPGSLYEWSAGRLKLISVLPADQGGFAVRGGLGGIRGAAKASTNARNAISADGSRIVWSGGEGVANVANALYLRDIASEETIRLDVVQPGATGSGPAQPQYQTASADGSLVFFTDTQRLTPDSGAAEGEPDLYRCEILIAESGAPECDLADLTPESSGEPAAVGEVIAASNDGSYLYFGAQGILTGATPNARGELAEDGKENLYLYHEGSTKLVAVLPASDGSSLSGPSAFAKSRVSPNGRYLAFISRSRLTDFDNRDAASGKPDREIFLYDATAEGGGSELVCGSCSPTGARPNGFTEVPGWLQIKAGGFTLHQPRYLSDSGRLFFESPSPLVPRDSNGTKDVYQYEPEGVGSCEASSPTFYPASMGCINLISSGTSAKESVFLDASESGDDVFFLTAARLSGQDSDTALDIYDARSGGGFAEPIPPPACEGDGCQQPAVPPSDPTPGSLTFNGAGNVHEAKSKKKHHKAKHHKKRSHTKIKRAAGHNRGGTK